MNRLLGLAIPLIAESMFVCLAPRQHFSADTAILGYRDGTGGIVVTLMSG